jgi:hypothetical protein
MPLRQRWSAFRERRRQRRQDRRGLRAERKARKHEYGADKAWGESWKGGGGPGGP